MCSSVTYKYICGHTESTTYPCTKRVKKPEQLDKACPETGEPFETKLLQGCHDCELLWKREWRRRHGIRKALPDRANGGVNPRPINQLQRRLARLSRLGVRPLQTSQLVNVGVIWLQGLPGPLPPSQVFRLLRY